jgi:hypothetical protein
MFLSLAGAGGINGAAIAIIEASAALTLLDGTGALSCLASSNPTLIASEF